MKSQPANKSATWTQLPTFRVTGLGPCSQPSGPVGSGPGGRWTCGHGPRTHLLVLPIVAGDCPMSSLSLNGLPIRADQHRRHQAKGAKAWRVGRPPLSAGTFPQATGVEPTCPPAVVAASLLMSPPTPTYNWEDRDCFRLVYPYPGSPGPSTGQRGTQRWLSSAC